MEGIIESLTAEALLERARKDGLVVTIPQGEGEEGWLTLSKGLRSGWGAVRRFRFLAEAVFKGIPAGILENKREVIFTKGWLGDDSRIVTATITGVAESFRAEVVRFQEQYIQRQHNQVRLARVFNVKVNEEVEKDPMVVAWREEIDRLREQRETLERAYIARMTSLKKNTSEEAGGGADRDPRVAEMVDEIRRTEERRVGLLEKLRMKLDGLRENRQEQLPEFLYLADEKCKKSRPFRLAKTN